MKKIDPYSRNANRGESLPGLHPIKLFYKVYLSDFRSLDWCIEYWRELRKPDSSAANAALFLIRFPHI